MSNVFATFIIPNGLKNSCIAKIEAKDAQGQFLQRGLPGMFETPLIATGDAANAPTKAWISSGMMSPEEIAYLNAQLPGPFEFSTGEYIDEQGKPQKEDGHGFMSRKGFRMKPGTL
jgi:hypothetical protein